jgi:hypothetical protein
MSEITAGILGAHQAAALLALKQSVQQDRAVLELVQKALESPQQGTTLSSDRLVDILV